MTRPVAGRINGVHAPEGSIMGPTWTDELLSVIENDDEGVILGYATREELDASTADPQTMAEFRKNRRAQVMVRARFAALFGGNAGL